MSQTRALALSLIVFFASLTPAPSSSAQGDTPYLTGMVRWRSAEGQFANWQRDGVALAPDGLIRLNPQAARPGKDPYAAGKYSGKNFYNGGSFFMGEAISPITQSSFPFSQAIPSWNAETPPGTWLEVQLRVQIGARWTKWYNMGVWAADSSTIERHSVKAQNDTNGTVAVDTLTLGTRTKPLTATAFQFKVRLFSVNLKSLPSIRNAAVAFSTTPQKPGTLEPGNRSLWNKKLAVPQCSQMVYPDGGEVWCSPVAVSMVLAYWQKTSGPCEPRVRAAVESVYDWQYRGHGNWPFNTAYAANHKLEGYVTRFTSLTQVEEWVAAGVPVVVSLAWSKKQLTGAPVSSTNGHLAVLVGFDASGNPIVNDPAAPTNAAVQRTYLRSEFERLWLQHSGGTVYLVHPPDRRVPDL